MYGSAGAFILVDKTIICVRGNFVLTVLSRFSSSARMPLKPKFNLEKHFHFEKMLEDKQKRSVVTT